MYTKRPSNADGHCLLYSCISSLFSQHGISVTKTTMINQILQECQNHRNVYDHVFDADIANMFETELHEYTQKREYRSLFGDILPNVIANFLQMKIIIIYKQGDEFMYHKLPQSIFPRYNSSFNDTTGKALILLKNDAHYDGLDYNVMNN